MTLALRPWVPAASETLVQRFAGQTAAAPSAEIAARLDALGVENRRIHEQACFNLNPATNVMNPAAEALLANGMGTRPSLGYPGDKYEMGLEAVEEAEVIAAELAAEVFNAKFAEIRVASGAMANLYAFMATCTPGDTIIVPPAAIGGHVTHHTAGCAGLFGLRIIEAPIDANCYTIDIPSLADLAARERPALITLGGSLNLVPHPVAAVRAIADDVGAKVLMDAAHQCGLFAGGAWPDPLAPEDGRAGAHLMTMSTYKSLGGPAGGLIVTNDADIAKRLDSIAFPGMTANFDASKSAALARTLLDWRDHGAAYAAEMVRTAQGLAKALQDNGMPVFETRDGPTRSHAFAVPAHDFGGGQVASKHLYRAGIIACGIGIPAPEIRNDMNAIRFGTPETTRFGVGQGRDDLATLASLIARALRSKTPEDLAPETAVFRAKFRDLHYVS
ncbi:DegT/DnrJ/EryC1/StrS family aminotransferase [Rhodobacteraceae bacterium N5(2021)]|uniref:DegT/DnrJ/EryC1/StrS family aminotransferase n=1 Tax=Gymnodinialimonas phycosphaerae TaxID=2841589 RepID=A0A975YGN5_9RHOB|nr:beta-eliminating lyase-related protein [Gymnodinialimonas phycosphaerae]MBY4891857.1 DegT/DnrJ/EryC1/StrS family aminotransferase [Gymnodinialimonas phycosphaerae]